MFASGGVVPLAFVHVLTALVVGAEDEAGVAVASVTPFDVNANLFDVTSLVIELVVVVDKCTSREYTLASV